MLENDSIICFAHDWEGDPTSKTHIMRILAKKNRVLWVNSIGMRRPTASRADFGRMALKLRRGLAGCREVEPNLHVVSPLTLPFPGSRVASGINASLLEITLRRFSRRLGLRRPILWSFLPNVSPLLGRLGERMVIYHCVDEYSAFTGVPGETLKRMETDLIRRSHLVLTSAERLRDERLPFNPETHFIPHGVDVAHFSKALDPATKIPEDLRSLPRPIIGFFGLIADWVDLGIVRSLALSRPRSSIVLLGKSACDLREIQGLRNVHLLGRKPYSDLPAYCRGFDVGILPFRINRLTLRANPLKLREYLAAGLPVVATPLPEVARYEQLVRLATRDDDFIAGVDEALRGRTPAADARRVAAMREESWEARVERISSIITRRRLAMAS
jgi:glycosyltransferase involved in cell wall biosynthesis